jgi:hypothetical protein
MDFVDQMQKDKTKKKGGGGGVHRSADNISHEETKTHLPTSSRRKNEKKTAQREYMEWYFFKKLKLNVV